MTGVGALLTLLAGTALVISTFRKWAAEGEEPSAIRAAHGDTVRIHYTGWLKDGSMFDSSQGNDPLEFTIGAGHVIPGTERAVVGMEVGETKLAVVLPDEAYGPTIPEYVTEIPRSRLPAGDVQVGDLMEVPGSPILARVLELRGEMVLVDVNHPLAGRELTFEVSLLEIVERGGA
jgi:peptidylprolyl isomerase